jgi:hypothetical protein
MLYHATELDMNMHQPARGETVTVTEDRYRGIIGVRSLELTLKKCYAAGPLIDI